MEFQTEFIRCHSEMIRFATSLTRCEHKAKDLVQEAAVRAFRHHEKLTDKDKFSSWFSTIVYNTFINAYRKKSRRKELLDMASASQHFFNKTTTRNAGLEALKVQDIKELSQKVGSSSYNAFKMHVAGYSYNDISEHLDIAVGTVKSRIHSARSKMKELTVRHQIAS